MDYEISFRHKTLGEASIRVASWELETMKRIISSRGMETLDVKAL